MGKNNPDVHPLYLFSIAVGLHFFVNDHGKREEQPYLYDYYGRWILSGGLLAGYVLGWMFTIPEPAIAMVVAFIAGGVIMNVLAHEIPEDNPKSFPWFVLGALIYTAIVLKISA